MPKEVYEETIHLRYRLYVKFGTEYPYRGRVIREVARCLTGVEPRRSEAHDWHVDMDPVFTNISKDEELDRVLRIIKTLEEEINNIEERCIDHNSIDHLEEVEENGRQGIVVGLKYALKNIRSAWALSSNDDR